MTLYIIPTQFIEGGFRDFMKMFLESMGEPGLRLFADLFSILATLCHSRNHAIGVGSVMWLKFLTQCLEALCQLHIDVLSRSFQIWNPRCVSAQIGLTTSSKAINLYAQVDPAKG